MCEEATTVVYCVGYILPIGCCVAGACMSCYGCYRYYYASRMRRLQADNNRRRVILEQPKIKRDTLKSRITERFLNLIGSKEDTALDVALKDVSFKDLKESCPICLMDYEQDSSQIFIGLIKGCGHYFHFECIWEWLERKQTCPICRESCDLAESDIWGLSLKQVLDFINVDPDQGLTTTRVMEEKTMTKKQTLDQIASASSGNNVVHIHLDAGGTSQGDLHTSRDTQNRADNELGKNNSAFQADNADGLSSNENDLADGVMTSPEITRT